jgi:LytTr DNA-binding domain
MAAIFAQKKYPDFWIRLIGSIFLAQFMVSLGTIIPFFDLLKDPVFWLDLGVGTIISFLTWSLVKWVWIQLDRRYDWLQHTTWRLLWQLIFGLLSPAVVILVMMYLYFRIAFQVSLFQDPWINNEYRVCLLILLLFNGYYLAYYFFKHLEKVQQTPNKAAAAKPGLEFSPSVLAQRGNLQIPIKVQDIAYFYLKEDIYFLKTTDNQQYIISSKLEELGSKLDPSQFFRVNRKFLAHIQACKAYKAVENGKLELSLNPPAPEVVIVSQKKAASFRDWIKQAH